MHSMPWTTSCSMSCLSNTARMQLLPVPCQPPPAAHAGHVQAPNRPARVQQPIHHPGRRAADHLRHRAVHGWVQEKGVSFLLLVDLNSIRAPGITWVGDRRSWEMQAGEEALGRSWELQFEGEALVAAALCSRCHARIGTHCLQHPKKGRFAYLQAPMCEPAHLLQ